MSFFAMRILRRRNGVVPYIICLHRTINSVRVTFYIPFTDITTSCNLPFAFHRLASPPSYQRNHPLHITQKRFHKTIPLHNIKYITVHYDLHCEVPVPHPCPSGSGRRQQAALSYMHILSDDEDSASDGIDEMLLELEAGEYWGEEDEHSHPSSPGDNASSNELQLSGESSINGLSWGVSGKHRPSVSSKEAANFYRNMLYTDEELTSPMSGFPVVSTDKVCAGPTFVAPNVCVASAPITKNFDVLCRPVQIWNTNAPQGPGGSSRSHDTTLTPGWELQCPVPKVQSRSLLVAFGCRDANVPHERPLPLFFC